MAAVKETLFSKSAIEQVQQLEKCTKCRILNEFWPHLKLSPKSFIEEEYEGFFWYIGKTLQDLAGHEDDFATQSFESLVGIIQTLRDNPSWSQKDMVVGLRRNHLNATDTAICRSIHLAVQLWLCLNVYSQDIQATGPIKPRDSRVHWKFDEPLGQMIAAQFPDGPSKTAPNTTYQIDDSLTLANLKRICGLQIRWTNNLKDHLRLEGKKGHRILSVYQHRIFLVNHYSEPESVFSKGVLREAIWTFDLLLLYGDPATEKLLQQSKVMLGVPLEGRQAYDLQEFTYWRSNLTQLLEILHGPPESLFQSLRDTRNVAQWVTIWLAVFGIFVLTLVFGILTTVYSILQYRVAVKSYELSLVVACQQRTGPFPGFCD